MIGYTENIRRSNTVYKWRFRIFSSCLIMYIILNMISSTPIFVNFGSVGDLLQKAVYFVLSAILLVSAFTSQNSRQEQLNLIILMVVLLAIEIFTQNFNLMVITAFCVDAVKFDFRKILKIHVAVVTIVLFTIILLNNAGIIPDANILRGTVVREAMGFTHPNVTASFITSIGIDIAALTMYNRWKSGIILNLVLCYFVNEVTGSRTALFALLVVVLLSFLFNAFSSGARFVLVTMLKYVTILLPLISVGLVWAYNANSALLTQLDEYLSGRLSEMNFVLRYGGFHLFSRNHINEINSMLSNSGLKVTVDNVYVYLLTSVGLVFLLIFILYCYVIMKGSIHNNCYWIVMGLFTILILGLSESRSYDVANNVFLLAGGQISQFVNQKEEYESCKTSSISI